MGFGVATSALKCSTGDVMTSRHAAKRLLRCEKSASDDRYGLLSVFSRFHFEKIRKLDIVTSGPYTRKTARV